MTPAAQDAVRRIMLEFQPEAAASIARALVMAVADNLGATLAPERCGDAIHAARDCAMVLDVFVTEVERVTLPAPEAAP